MQTLIAIFIGVLFAAGMFCLLRRNLTRLIIGILLISQGANLLVFTTGGLTEAKPPLIAGGDTLPPEGFADPLPQALVLTAIVIGSGLVAFALALAYRASQAVGDDDLNAFNRTDAS